MLSIEKILNTSPIMPVCVIDDTNNALPLANALLEGGIQSCEVTLRTPQALEVIKKIRTHLPEMLVGAGSVTNINQYEDALAYGAQFIVSPGLLPAMVQRAQRENIPILPGVMSPTEILKGLELGVYSFKLFPAKLAGGVEFLKAVSAPIPQAQFCPTGGVNLANLGEYLECPNVQAVGGTWLTPKKELEAKNFLAITSIVKKSLKKL